MEKDEKDINPNEVPSSPERGQDVMPEVEDVEGLKKALSEEKAKAAEHLANWQRAQADFINYKRRVEQERNDTTKFANSVLILNLLPVLDDMERALENVSAETAGMNWVEGVKLIYRKLQSVLQGQGLTEIKALGQPFDPNLHEAVLYDEGEEGVVTEDFQKGYKLQERVLRPAMVKVGRGVKQAKPDKEEQK